MMEYLEGGPVEFHRERCLGDGHADVSVHILRISRTRVLGLDIGRENVDMCEGDLSYALQVESKLRVCLLI